MGTDVGYNDISVFFSALVDIIFNPYPAELIYSNFQTIEVMSHYRDPQPPSA